MQDEVEVTVDGVTYKLSELSEEAQAQANNLQFVDAQIAELQAKLAVFQTARNAYQAALQQLVPRIHQ
jgi:DNA repair ATPase RecN